MKYTLEQINQMTQPELISAIGWIFEHSPWVAGQVWPTQPWGSPQALYRAMRQTVEAAPNEAKLALIKAHPDLGSRAKMADVSVSEQKGAGLDRLNPQEFERIQHLNAQYVERFGFPFIFAVKGKTKEDIFVSMEARLSNTLEAEFEEALEQIYKIAGFRLADILEGE